MRRLKVFIAFLIVAIFFAHVEASAQTVTLVNSSWAPYKGNDLPNGGVVTDIARQALERAGYQVKTISAPWKRALKGAYSGQYDVVPAIWHNDERAEKLLFSKPVMQSRVVFISRPEVKFEFSGYSDLDGWVVGVGSGWGYPEAFKNAKKFVKEEAVDLNINMKKLVYGRLELIVAEEIAARYTASKLFSPERAKLHYSKMAIQENDLHIAVSKQNKSHKEIIERFDKAIAEMHRDGTFAGILKFHGVEGVKAPY